MSPLSLPYTSLITQIIGMTGLSFSMFSLSKEQKITYPWWKRLWRIYRYLNRSRRKRKFERNEKKRKKREEKRFERRKKRRKLKVILKSFFRKKRSNRRETESAKEAKRLKYWKKRKRRRLFKAYLKGFFKSKKKNERRLYIEEKRKEGKQFSKYRRRRIFRFVLRRNLEIIGDFLKGKGLPERRKKEGPSIWQQILRGDQLIISVNSLALFLMSYFFIDFLSNLSMAITSLLFDYKTVIYYYNIEFLVDYDDWFADAVKTIFATGPVVGLIIAFLSLIIYSKVYLENGVLKTLLLWSIFHGANSIISGTLMGNIMGKGFGYVIMYLYYSDTGKLIMSLLMIMISIIIGTVSTRYWIMSANSYYNYSKPHNRPVFIISQVFIPFVVGTLLIWLITLPEGLLYDTLVNISMIFMILPPLFLNKYYQEYYFDEEPRKIKYSINIILFTILFIAAIRILLDIGLRIG